ncbi:MAG: 50S ribosomal protein L21 [Verrucomicrobia bacterium]|nr:50S ribosomal protein L21 [Verrucomicrobiota bacterium]MBU6447084.1 50S ribosomal protein L21 [Verrucomicrobiota bacterium]MDE3047287.1 50S ribosomal protein L21 [Verrucomicrobiota bacterium]
MYAIIETGGKQYRVEEGDVLDVELLHADGEVKFDKVLMLHDGKAPKVGHPHLKHCAVHAEVIGMEKGPKVISFKYKRCKNYRRTVGHRQKYSRVKIKKIVAA